MLQGHPQLYVCVGMIPCSSVFVHSRLSHAASTHISSQVPTKTLHFTPNSASCARKIKWLSIFDWCCSWSSALMLSSRWNPILSAACRVMIHISRNLTPICSREFFLLLSVPFCDLLVAMSSLIELNCITAYLLRAGAIVPSTGVPLVLARQSARQY